MELDPLEIITNTETTMKNALQKANLELTDLQAIGVTNQRETTILWEKATGKPIHNAIVWQCTRTTEICEELQ